MKIMRSFRTFLATAAGRALCAAIVVASFYAFSDPGTYLYALEVQQAKEAQVRGIAAKLGVDPEFLLHPEGKKSFDLRGVMAWANARLGLNTATAMADTTQTTAHPLDARAPIAPANSPYPLL